jgi:O-antigen/teichoic acid export membrane protein
MISKKFLKSSVIYSVIGALPLGTSFVLLLFYANLLSTSDLGFLALYIVIALLVQIIVNFAMDTSIGVHFFEYKDKPEKLKRYVGTIAGLLLVVGVIFAIFTAFSGTFLFRIIKPLQDLKFFPYGFLSILTGISNSFFKTYTNLLINQERPDRYFWMNISTFVMTIVFSLGLLFLFPGTLIGPIWGRFIASFLNAVVAFYFFRTEFGITISGEFLHNIFVFCLPVFIFVLLAWVLSSLDRFIIKDLMKPADVAVYDFIVKCTVILEFIQNGLSSAVTPKVFNLFKEQNLRESTVEVNRYFNGYTLVNLLAVPLVIIAIPLLIPVLVKNHELYRGFSFVGLICLGFVTRSLYTMYTLPIYYFKRTKLLPLIFGLAAIFQVSFSIWGIRTFGLIGAVYAVLLSKFLQVFLLYLGSRSVFTFRVNKSKQFFLPLFYTVLSVASFFLFNQDPGLWVYLLQLVIIYIAAGIVFRKEIPAMILDIRKSKYYQGIFARQKTG